MPCLFPFLESEARAYHRSPGGVAVRVSVCLDPVARLRSVQKLVAEIMAAWRRAERLSLELPAGSPERLAAENACDRLREAFQELTHSGVAHAISAAEARQLLEEAAADIVD